MRPDRISRTGYWPALLLLLIAATAGEGFGAGFGGIHGHVTDPDGNPLMGVTVLLAGANAGGTEMLAAPIDRAFTNARGEFTIERIAPGWYSLQAISPTKVPALRDRVQVTAGKVDQEDFTLGDVLAHIHLKDPKPSLDLWENRWKWILRTSDSTRPVLRYRHATSKREEAEKAAPLPVKHLVAVGPGSAREDSIDSQPGMGGIVAYLRPLDSNSDMLVAGSMAQSPTQGSSLIASYRKNLIGNNPETISVVVHELSFGDGVQNESSVINSRAMVLRYMQTRQLSSALTLNAGVEVRYLDAGQHASTSEPEISLAYKVDPQTVVAVSYGTMEPEDSSRLVDRIHDLEAFPRVSLRGERPRLEQQKHAELRVDRKLGPNAHLEIAAYHDNFGDVAIWSAGDSQALEDAAAMGGVLFQPGGSRAILNAGSYGSSGIRAAYKQKMGSHATVSILYSTGEALTADSGQLAASFDPNALPQLVRPEWTQSLAGKFSTQIPMFKTEVVTSYGWMPAGRLTVVDPYGQNMFEFTPFLGVQVRQPLPRIEILPVHIVAVADFRNLLDQGSVTMAHDKPIALTPYYRSIRGGFAVQF